MLVDVTAEDIALGCRSAASHCPVARAVARAATVGHVSVDHRYINVYAEQVNPFKAGDLIKQWDTPDQVEKAIDLFDDCGTMDPFTFEL